MAKKLNLNGAKDFLFNHGEKVALGACAFVALLVGVLGFMDALGAGKAPDTGRPWVDDLKGQTDRITVSLNSPDVPKLSAEAVNMLKPDGYEWTKISTDYQPQPYINTPETPNDKRQNPRALAIRSGPKGTHLDYVPALVYTYEKFNTKEEVKILGEPQAGGNEAPFGPKKGGLGMAAAGGGGAKGNFMKAGDPRRMIIGHAVFPLKDQVAEFQRALNYPSQKEMFDAPREDLPLFLGFNLQKIEILPNGQPATEKPEVLLDWDPVNKSLFVADKLKKFLGVAMFDEKSPASLERYIFGGLTMPLPQLAFGSYPRVVLEGGIESAEDPDAVGDVAGPMRKTGSGAGMPKGNLPGTKVGPAKGPGMLEKEASKQESIYTISGMTRKELKELDRPLDGRLFDGDFNIYHALGLKPSQAGDEAPKANAPGMPRGQGGLAAADRYFAAWDIEPAKIGADGRIQEATPAPPTQPTQPKGFVPKGFNTGGAPKTGPGPGPGPGTLPGTGPADPQGSFPNWERDAVVRFIDIDAEPGKTYRYAIQIRLKNPNSERNKGDVAYAALTQVPELVSEWAYTEPITIPRDYFLYAVDQKLLDDGKAPPADPKIKDATTFQIHQWMTTPPNSEDQQIVYPIGDWVIAERVVVQKGSKIGPAAIVNTPFWVSKKDAFDLPPKKAGTQGIKIEMMPPVVKNGNNGIVGDDSFPYPILIDFIGGKRKVVSNLNVDEEVAVDALIVGADGKLRVLNSRDAVESTPAGREREMRVLAARRRVEEVTGASATTQKKGGTMPGLPGPGGGN